MSLGRDLLDVPFAEMVRNLAIAIADGQTALDRNSLETLKVLNAEKLDVLTEVTEIIEPITTQVPVTVRNESGQLVNQTVTVTGAQVRPSGVATTQMNMLQAGLFPTFYQFTEASIEVKMAITMREENQGNTSGRTSSSGGARGFLGLGASRAHASSVDFRTQNVYGYEATGASVLRATLRPVPPPSRLQPALTTINTFTTPPTVTQV